MTQILEEPSQFVESEFEQRATAKYLTMSDDSQIRVLMLNAPKESKNGFTMMIMGGWGTIVHRWDTIVLEAAKYFDIVFFESREKHSSILVKKSKHDLDRISTDVQETIKILGINEEKLVCYSSSWGSIFANHGLAYNKFDPFLTVLIGPTARLALPPGTRYIVPFAPPWLFSLFKPITRYWLVNHKAEDEIQEAKYLRVMNEADPKKWKQVAKHVMFWHWDLFPKIKNRILIIAASQDDKMHNLKETKKISGLLENSEYLDLKTSEKMDSPLVITEIRNYIKKMEII